MKRKFKHKKTGEQATYENGVLTSGGFSVEIGVEPSKEYWEEITPKKEYEILEWSYGHNHELITQNPDGTAGEYKIYSVKRLSDEEIFTIGDKVILDAPGFKKQEATIRYFQIKDDKLFAAETHLVWSILSKVKKVNPVLFTTEDGVEIRKGDEIYVVTSWLEYQGKYIGSENTMKLLPGRKIFSTEQAAKDYILKNKRVLSFNDVWNSTTNKSSDNNYVVIEKKKLLELVKSKI